MMLCAVCTGAWATEETITFSEQGYSNGEAITEVSGTNFSITFNKGTNSSNAPKYYSTGTSIRAYGGNYFTVSSSSTINKIKITFGENDGSNTITTNVNSYSNGTWEGSSNSVKFTIGGTTGNRRLSAITVTLEGGSSSTKNDVETFAFNETAPSIDLKTRTTYQQEVNIVPSTYDGDVTYSLSANTAGATIDGSKVTVTQAGSVTITASGTETETFNAPTPTSYTLTVTDVDSYTLFTGNLVEGDYIICYNGKAMKNSRIASQTKRLGYETVTPTNDVIVNSDASIVWHIAPNGDYWTIFNLATNNYAAATGVKNEADMQSVADNYALWTVSGSETFEFVNKNNAANNINANLRNNGTNGFACYSTSTGGALSLYKASHGKTPIVSNLPSSLTSENLVIGSSGTFSLTGASFANENYTINWESLSTGIITLQGASSSYTTIGTGQAIIKVTVTPSDEDNYLEVIKEYTVIVEKNIAEIGAIDDMNLVTGATQEFTVTCNSDAVITVSSSNTNVANVASVQGTTNKWIVTATGRGTATITITSPATDNFKQAIATFSVKVTGNLAPGTLFYESFDSSAGEGGNDNKWKGITNLPNLVCDNEGWVVPNNSGANKCAKLGTANAGQSATTPAIATEGSAVTLSFRAGSWDSDNATLYVDILDGETVKETKSYNLPNAQFGDYSIDITDVSELKIKFYCNASLNRFFLDEVAVQKEVITATFKKKFMGYTSIYYSDKNLVVPENVTAHTYKVEGGKGSYSVDYEAGAVIPKGTGVILEYSDKNIPDDGITVVLEETTEAGTADPDNMLRGFDTAQETTVDEGENPENYYFYRYTVGKGNKSNKIGFYFADETGSQFTAGAHKIYLAVLRSQFDEGVNASYIEDDTTGIDKIMASTTQKGTYTLSGIQVRTDNLPKGIYIVNGKKMVIK